MMTDITSDDRRRAFAIWLRTGRPPTPQPSAVIECKFNPWHDPEDGRFTFANTGRYYGRGGGGVAGRGGSFGGAGASGAWGGRELPPKVAGRSSRIPLRMPIVARPVRPSVKPKAPAATLAPVRIREAEQFDSITSNGYTYRIDKRGRTRQAAGELKLAETQRRSRKTQAAAGGSERRRSDDGGHYIAAQFGGPTDAFNHFAQNLSFNRGGYLALENQWAKARRAGKSVTVKIVPHYDGSSVRPSEIDVSFTIDGLKHSLKFPNERVEKPNGK